MVALTWNGQLIGLTEKGFVESFLDPKGVQRVRLTPVGARSLGEEELAKALEKCKTGLHTPFGKAKCACGES